MEKEGDLEAFRTKEAQVLPGSGVGALVERETEREAVEPLGSVFPLVFDVVDFIVVS